MGCNTNYTDLHASPLKMERHTHNKCVLCRWSGKDAEFDSRLWLELCGEVAARRYTLLHRVQSSQALPHEVLPVHQL